MNFSSAIKILLMLCLELVAIHLFQKSNKTNNHIFLVIGMFLYSLLGWILFKVLQESPNVVIVNNLWQMLNVILVTLVGITYFECSLSIFQGVGVLFAFASVVCLSCGGDTL